MKWLSDKIKTAINWVAPSLLSTEATGAEESVFPAIDTPIEPEPVLAFKTLDQVKRFIDAGTGGESKAFFNTFDQTVINKNDTLTNAIKRRNELYALVAEVDLVINDTELSLGELVLFRSYTQ